jgi:acetolactate synthase-1/2/3 large subunit
MGTAIPTAIGVAIASHKKRIVCIMGDGGVRPYIAEIKLAVQERLQILFILMSDGRYGTVTLSGIENNFSARAVMIDAPSWRRAIEAMGCPSASINSENGLVNSIKKWSSGIGPMFLELQFDADKYASAAKRLR